MIVFVIIVAVVVFILAPFAARAGVSMGGLVVATIALLAFGYMFKQALVRLAVILFFVACGLWLAWSFIYPVYKAGQQAIADGKELPGATWAAAKEAASKVVKKVLDLPGWLTSLYGGVSGVDRIAQDRQTTEQMCLTSTQVKKSLLAEDPRDSLASSRVAMYCKGQGARNFQNLKGSIDAFAEGALNERYPFLTGEDPTVVNTPKYFECLHRWVTGDPQKRFVETSKECYVQDIYSVPTKWRLCVEMGIQVYWDSKSVNYTGAPLAQEIAGCRTWAKQQQ